MPCCVTWWTAPCQLQGTFYTNMNLKAFPFDYQNLLLQMDIPQVQLGESCFISRHALCLVGGGQW